MICTEDEAKSKWCPMARVHCPDAGCSDNRDADGERLGVANCVASDCMLWCWDDDEYRGWCGLSHGDNR